MLYHHSHQNKKQHPVGCCFCFLSYLSEIFDKYLSLSGTVKSV